MRITTRAVFGAMAGAAMLSGAAAEDTMDWSGFYAGILAGYGLDTAAATSSTTGPLTVETDPGTFLTLSENSSLTRFNALFGGVQAGYNHQVDAFVLGAEGTVELGGFTKANSSSFTYNLVDGADFSNNSIASQTDFSVDWLTTFTGRLGFDMNGWLLYGKAGVAMANISAKSNSSYTLDSNTGGGLLGPLGNGTYASSTAYSGLRGGAVFGLGAETKLSQNVSLGAEYTYVHLGDVDVPSAGILGGLLGGSGPQTFNANMHSVKASLKYHF